MDMFLAPWSGSLFRAGPHERTGGPTCAQSMTWAQKLQAQTPSANQLWASRTWQGSEVLREASQPASSCYRSLLTATELGLSCLGWRVRGRGSQSRQDTPPRPAMRTAMAGRPAVPIGTPHMLFPMLFPPSGRLSPHHAPPKSCSSAGISFSLLLRIAGSLRKALSAAAAVPSVTLQVITQLSAFPTRALLRQGSTCPPPRPHTPKAYRGGTYGGKRAFKQRLQ